MQITGDITYLIHCLHSIHRGLFCFSEVSTSSLFILLKGKLSLCQHDGRGWKQRAHECAADCGVSAGPTQTGGLVPGLQSANLGKEERLQRHD